MTTRLVIGSRNACAWSFATWLAMRVFELPFEDVLVPLDRPESEGLLGRFSPSGKVPVLVEDKVTVWESLAILEHLAERHPAMWPNDPAERAVARAVAAEAHAGLPALHRFLPMDLVARFAPPGRLMRAVGADLKRVRRIWTELRAAPGAKDGPFLFGRFTIADAMFAPIAARFVTYALPAQDPACAAYVEALIGLPAFREWSAEAASEVAAFARVPASPFHRTAPEPLAIAMAAPAAPVRTMPAPPPAAAAAPAVPQPAGTAAGVAAPAQDAPPRAAAPPAPRPRLDEADRPLIAYLDEAPSGRMPTTPVRPPEPGRTAPAAQDARPAERAPAIGYLDQTPGAAAPPPRPADMPPAAPRSAAMPVRPAPAPAGAGPSIGQGAALPTAGVRHSSPAAMPAGAGAGEAAAGPRPAPPAGDAGNASPMRLRRPGTAGGEAAGRPDNRFTRALSGGRERPAEPDERVLTTERPPAGPPPAEAPRPAAARPGPRASEPVPAQDEAEPAHPRTIRPSAIKPIGFSAYRRR
jgi:glutathione S-transferase